MNNEEQILPVKEELNDEVLDNLPDWDLLPPFDEVKKVERP